MFSIQNTLTTQYSRACENLCGNKFHMKLLCFKICKHGDNTNTGGNIFGRKRNQPLLGQVVTPAFITLGDRM